MSTSALQGAGTGDSNSQHNINMNSPDDDDLSSSHVLSFIDSKDESLRVLKSDLKEALDKAVKSLDEDDWMFNGPRSRINLISKPGKQVSSMQQETPNL